MDRLQLLVTEHTLWSLADLEVEWVDARDAPVVSVDGCRFTDTVIRGTRALGLFEIVDDGNGSFANRPMALQA